MDEYKTITAQSSAEFTVQRSRFIANVFPVTSEEEAAEKIREMKKKYFDARHNCSAFRLGIKGALRRSSDDGEPSGTAGAPILEAITQNDLTDVLIVVTRYFGGIKLGTGGLTRAYSKAAMLGIEASPLAIATLFSRIAVTIDYPLLGATENLLRKKELSIDESDYGENVTLVVLVRPNDEESFIADITELTAAKAKIEKCGQVWKNLPI